MQIMNIEEIFDSIHDELEEVEILLQQQGSGAEAPVLSRVGAHILSAGGKRFRPALSLLCGRLCGTPKGKRIPLAAAIELIHNATLLHDDIVDKAAIRRGQTAAHLLWGDTAGVLTANLHFSKAFSLILEAGGINCLQIVTQTLNTIVEGELLQFFRVGFTQMDEALYQEIISRKTAHLISTACQVGAEPGNKEAYIKSLVSFGYELGMAFQITDDLLDYTAEEEALGKKIGNDFLEAKLTLPLIITLSRSSPSEKQALLDLLLASQEERHAHFIWAKELIEKYQGFKDTYQKACEHIDKAIEALSFLPQDNKHLSLISLARFVIERTK